MKKLFAIVAAAAVISVAAPATAQSINVRIGDGYRHHPHHGYYGPRKKVVVIRDRHRHWDRGHHYGWRNANRGPTVVFR